jgi:hypothetical protein
MAPSPVHGVAASSLRAASDEGNPLELASPPGGLRPEVVALQAKEKRRRTPFHANNSTYQRAGASPARSSGPGVVWRTVQALFAGAIIAGVLLPRDCLYAEPAPFGLSAFGFLVSLVFFIWPLAIASSPH